MRKRNLIGAAAFSLALAGGGMAGAVLGTPGVSGAQDGTTSTTEQSTDEAKVHRGPGGVRPGVQAAAEDQGMTTEELLAELKAGKSIAEVAEAKGVDLGDVTDAMVAAGTARLQEMIEALPERVDQAVQRKGLPDRPERGHRGPGGHRPADAPRDAPAEDAASESS